MPTSVLLAVLAAAGLLALAPALVRRYDATERQVAERERSTARVLSRTRRRRTVPGRRPVNPPRRLPPTLRAAAPVSPAAPRASGTDAPAVGATAGSTADAPAAYARAPGLGSAGPEPAGGHGYRAARRGRRGTRERQHLQAVMPRSAPPARRPRRRRYSPAIYRRRRLFAALVLLNLIELFGAVILGPVFWAGFAVTATLLVAFLAYLRTLAIADQRRRRLEARRAALVAAQQAQVRREQARRAAARREAARRAAAQREALRRAARTSPTVSYRRAGGSGRAG